MEVGPPCILRPRPSASSSPTPSKTASSTAGPSAVPSVTPSPSSSPTDDAPTSDPFCLLGKKSGTACCPQKCTQCGGSGCGTAGPNGETCCSGKIKEEMPPCTVALPPCVIVDVTPPSPTAITSTGKWEYVTGISGSLTPRHEACFVFVNGKGYLIGGRRKDAPVDIFDPVAKTWTKKRGFGEKIHHMQCVAHDGKVWIPSSWKGDYPNEVNHDRIIIYDTVVDEWSTLPGLPAHRLRGGAASVLHENKIYVVGGNRGGHGDHATAYGWMDAYNLASGEWELDLGDVPEARDHVGGAMVNGRLCIAGGRNSGTRGFFKASVASTWCFDFGERIWVRGEDLQVPRAGAATGTSCDGRLMIVGGETERTVAWERVDFFDGEEWTRGADLNRGRHGSGLGVSGCECGRVYIASGSGNKGGSPELESTEVYVANGGGEDC